jgi:ABC-type bacteriocin/lantibiotic exporter with double-glycine peptidase domain
MKEKEYIYFRESALQSIIAYLFTFAFLAILFLFNHLVLGDSKVSAFVFFVVFILFTLGKGNSRRETFTDKEALKKYILETL